MSSIRFLVSTYCVKLITVIFLLSKIIPSCSCCKEKKLVYIIIIAPFSYQPSFYIKCTKLNIYSFYNVKLVSNTDWTLQDKYIFDFIHLEQEEGWQLKGAVIVI